MKKLFIKKLKILLVVFLFIFTFNFSSSFVKSVNAQSAEEKALQGLSNLSSGSHGLMPCDPFSDNKGYDANSSDHQCSPKDAIKILKTLMQISLYLVIISLVLMLIISGVAYVYNGNNSQFLTRWKKRIKNSVYALLIIIIGMGLVLGIMSALGMQKEVLDFLKELLANKDFSLFNHAIAADDPISSIADSVSGEATDKGVGYVNFFPNQTIPSLILLSIKFLINYGAAPALVGATIWAGFLFVKAQGNAEALKKAKAFALRVVIGIAIAAAASGAVAVMLNTLDDIARQVKIESPAKEKENTKTDENKNSDTAKDNNDSKGIDLLGGIADILGKNNNTQNNTDKTQSNTQTTAIQENKDTSTQNNSSGQDNSVQQKKEITAEELFDVKTSSANITVSIKPEYSQDFYFEHSLTTGSWSFPGENFSNERTDSFSLVRSNKQIYSIDTEDILIYYKYEFKDIAKPFTFKMTVFPYAQPKDLKKYKSVTGKYNFSFNVK